MSWRTSSARLSRRPASCSPGDEPSHDLAREVDTGIRVAKVKCVIEKHRSVSSAWLSDNRSATDTRYTSRGLNKQGRRR